MLGAWAGTGGRGLRASGGWLAGRLLARDSVLLLGRERQRHEAGIRVGLSCLLACLRCSLLGAEEGLGVRCCGAQQGQVCAGSPFHRVLGCVRMGGEATACPCVATALLGPKKGHAARSSGALTPACPLGDCTLVILFSWALPTDRWGGKRSRGLLLSVTVAWLSDTPSCQGLHPETTPFPCHASALPPVSPLLACQRVSCQGAVLAWGKGGTAGHQPGRRSPPPHGRAGTEKLPCLHLWPNPGGSGWSLGLCVLQPRAWKGGGGAGFGQLLLVWVGTGGQFLPSFLHVNNEG